MRRIASFVIGKLQGRRFYRKIARHIPSKVDVKEAGIEDLRKFYDQIYQDSIKPAPCSSQVSHFVAKNKKKVIGSAWLVRHDRQNRFYPGHWLFSLTVRFLYRGRGIGERLVQSVLERSKKENAEALSLVVWEDNRTAIGLYRKLGFERGSLPNLEECLERERLRIGRRRIVMSKRLSDDCH